MIHATLRALDWENHFFGVNSSKLHFNDKAPVLTEAMLNVWSRVQAKISAHQTDLLDNLQQVGFQFVEGEVELSLGIDVPGTSMPLVVATPDMIPNLRQQAGHAFKQSRFRHPWYKHDDSGRFYAQWVENAVLGTFDDQCLVRCVEDKISGFVTLRKLNQREARIGLIAGRGVGAELIAGAQFWCQQRGLDRLWVSTQLSNIVALRRYTQSGAIVENTSLWLYR